MGSDHVTQGTEKIAEDFVKESLVICKTEKEFLHKIYVNFYFSILNNLWR